MRVLLMAEDRDFVTELTTGLRRLGWLVEVDVLGTEAVDRCHEVDAVVVDLMHTGIDGLALVRELRTRCLVPIVLVSSHDDELDRILGLKLGADDFLVRPFGLRELGARLEAVVRRVTGDWERAVVPAGNSRAIRIDVRGRSVRVQDRHVNLTRKEFDILALLASDPGRVFGREDIMTEVWGHDGAGDTRTLGVHMVGLRRKLGEPDAIETVRGVGFRLAAH
ncbi:response regulator transcription factor [Kineosporia sp. NBRC 101731]|uniref:response regulator transcription factor n=1 Tax=Kineosporia sp. NBRC 101731 TaxID=3032199 RepID=UPI002556AC7B|nr:response regulator transcription factor [Kineosporia sp. NBRC 101731]